MCSAPRSTAFRTDVEYHEVRLPFTGEFQGGRAVSGQYNEMAVSDKYCLGERGVDRLVLDHQHHAHDDHLARRSRCRRCAGPVLTGCPGSCRWATGSTDPVVGAGARALTAEAPVRSVDQAPRLARLLRLHHFTPADAAQRRWSAIPRR